MRSGFQQPRRTVGRAAARAPGTCGELVQGVLGGRHFHVTCPVDMYATAGVELAAGNGRVFGPQDSPKAIEGVRLALAYVKRPDVDAYLTLSSPLPRGKGMASSTADVAAAIAGTAAALGRTLMPEEIARLALQVEPSDGLMFPGIVAFDHRSGNLYQPLGAAPAMGVVVLDFPGTVDTLAFNAVDRTSALMEREPQWQASLDMVREGLRARDARLVGQGATTDTLAHHGLVSETHRRAVLDLARRVGALGVNTAHSGTVFGLLLPPDDRFMREAQAAARARLPGLEATYRCHLVGGGIQYLPMVAPAALR